MKKKTAAVFCAAIMAVAMTGCGGQKSIELIPANKNSASSVTETSAAFSVESSGSETAAVTA